MPPRLYPPREEPFDDYLSECDTSDSPSEYAAPLNPLEWEDDEWGGDWDEPQVVS